MIPPKLTILFSGMMAGDPYQGGATWAVLQYLLGFRRLGHEVFFVEPVKPGAIRPECQSLAGSPIAAYFRRVTEEFGLGGCAALLAEDGETVGLGYQELIEIARRADVLVNVSGMLTDEGLLKFIPVRVYLDLDPAFIQLWQETQGIDMRFAGHNRFVTVGLALGTPDCVVPTCGLDWVTTTQPVVLEHWPVAGPITHDALTTVGNWRGYGSIEYEGVFYGQKVHSWRPLIHLPQLTPDLFSPALAIHPGETNDLAALHENGWCLLDPARVAATPDEYRGFIRGSKAEFGVAKSGYVASRCGWFSDRSACYLASGRPVIAQETGFSGFLPTGGGLFAFETPDDVLAAIAAINGDYPRHCRAARGIAEQFFDSDKVLSTLLDRLALI